MKNILKSVLLLLSILHEGKMAKKQEILGKKGQEELMNEILGW